MADETECDQCGDIGDWSEHDGICDDCMRPYPAFQPEERDEDDEGWDDDDYDDDDEDFPPWH